MGKQGKKGRLSPAEILLVLASGILTALAFPKFGLSFFVWISLIPVFFLSADKKPKQSFFLGVLAGFAFYALLLYWIPDVPAHYGGLSTGFSALIYIIFMLYLALFWGVFFWLLSHLIRRHPVSGYFFAPFVWVAFEFALTHLLTGFPWGLIGYAQYQNLPFIQLSSVTGIYGLSFMIVFFQSMFVLSIKQRKRRFFFAGLAILMLVHLGGFIVLRTSGATAGNFRASVIQGNVSSDIYWDRITTGEILALFERHMDLTDQAHSDRAQLIVWPEFSVPLCFSCSSEIYVEFKNRILRFVEETGKTLLIGTNETKSGEEENEYFNAALCVGPGMVPTEYYKMHLVPFGEYTPYKKIFSFINTMTHAIGDVTPGKETVLHEVKGIPFGSPICYEIIFPDLVRRFVKKGAFFLTTITNDGWYGKTSAPHQHFAIAVLRAVENRRYLLRAATTGISGIIDPFGRILKKTQLNTQTHLTEDIAPLSKLTPYARFGDVFAYGSLTLSLVILILAFVRRRK